MSHTLKLALWYDGSSDRTHNKFNGRVQRGSFCKRFISVYHIVCSYANASNWLLHANRNMHSDAFKMTCAQSCYAQTRNKIYINSKFNFYTYMFAHMHGLKERFFICFYFLVSSGLLVKALVHLVASHIGAFYSSLQLLLDHPRVTAMASQ